MLPGQVPADAGAPGAPLDEFEGILPAGGDEFEHILPSAPEELAARDPRRAILRAAAPPPPPPPEPEPRPPLPCRQCGSYAWRARQDCPPPPPRSERRTHLLPRFRVGQIHFEETDRIVPYLIVAKAWRGRAECAPLIVDFMVRQVRPTACWRLFLDRWACMFHTLDCLARQFGLRRKPSTAWECRASGRASYLEWAHELYRNPAMAESWGWCQPPLRYRSAGAEGEPDRGVSEHEATR